MYSAGGSTLNVGPNLFATNTGSALTSSPSPPTDLATNTEARVAEVTTALFLGRAGHESHSAGSERTRLSRDMRMRVRRSVGRLPWGRFVVLVVFVLVWDKCDEMLRWPRAGRM